MSALSHMLEPSPLVSTFESLPELWRMTTLELTLALPQGFDDDPSLPGRIRGAWGVRLAEWASRDAKDAASAREAFFGPAPIWRGQRTIPRPFTIAAERDASGVGLCVRLSLIGFADIFRDVAFDALIHALCGGEGLALSPDPGARRTPLPLMSADWSMRRSIPRHSLGLMARLLFRTPLKLGPRHTLGARYGDVIVSAADRVAALARWQGVAVEPHLSGWRDIANRLVFDGAAMRPTAWLRHSGAQGGRPVPMAGLIGPLDIHRPPESVTSLLLIAEQIHVGGGTSLGLGRFDML